MNGPLQRLVARARGTPDPTLRRIEPLLTPRYAPAAGAEATAPELQERQAAARTPVAAPVASAAAAAPRIGAPREIEALTEHGAAAEAPIAPTPAPRAAPPQELHVPDETGAAPAAAATITELRVERRVEARVETPSAASAVQVARSDAGRDDAPRPANPRAAAQSSIERRETVVHDAAPSVTVSIGRIDVHAPPSAPSVSAPAPPRRPAFRPSVTLDAFLRGGGERR